MVEAIHLGTAHVAELWTVDSVLAVAGKGLEGDRHFHGEGARPGQAITLVAPRRSRRSASRRARRDGR